MKNINTKLIRLIYKIAVKCGMEKETFLKELDLSDKERRILSIILED